MKHLIGVLMLVLAAPAAQAKFLFERAGGAAYYDWQQDITWLTDAGYIMIDQPDGDEFPWNDDLRTWMEAVAWVESLNTKAHLGITSWRLPRVLDTNSNGSDNGLCNGYSYVDQGEMAFMYYKIYGKQYLYDCAGNERPKPHGLTDTSPFINVNLHTHLAYWYGQELVTDPLRGWVMHHAYGGQHADGKTSKGPIWPVFDGDLLYKAGDPLPASITIDIHPWRPAKIIDPMADRLVPVILFGSDTFDASQIDTSTVRLAPGDTTAQMMPLARPVTDPLVADFDGDSYLDIATHFENLEARFVCGDTKATIYGETFTSEPFAGTEAIVTTQCESSSCHP